MRAPARAVAAPDSARPVPAARGDETTPSSMLGDRETSFVMVDPLASPFGLPVAAAGREAEVLARG